MLSFMGDTLLAMLTSPQLRVVFWGSYFVGVVVFVTLEHYHKLADDKIGY